MESFTFFAPTRLLFGPGKLNELGDQELPGKRALLVTTGGKSVKANGYLARGGSARPRQRRARPL